MGNSVKGVTQKRGFYKKSSVAMYTAPLLCNICRHYCSTSTAMEYCNFLSLVIMFHMCLHTYLSFSVLYNMSTVVISLFGYFSCMCFWVGVYCWGIQNLFCSVPYILVFLLFPVEMTTLLCKPQKSFLKQVVKWRTDHIEVTSVVQRDMLLGQLCELIVPESRLWSL